LGNERRSNPLLAHPDEDEFAAWFPTTFPAAPDYFFRMRPLNQKGPRLRREMPEPPRLSPADFDRARRSALVVDVRPQAEFMAGHISGALSNTFRDQFATWLGWVVPEHTALLFVLGDEPLERVLDECLLVGYERFAGVLEGGMSAWNASGMQVKPALLVRCGETRKLVSDGALALDVREDNEFDVGHIPGAEHIPLGSLTERAGELPRDRTIVTYCGHGERSATALSILERLGFKNVVNFDGGFGAWEDAGMEVER
jgi:rhodanese-related sulfurtransferase